MRDLQIGLDAVDILGHHEIERAVLGLQLRGEFLAGQREIGDVASQRCAMPAQVIGLPSRSTRGSPLARSTTLSVIGSRGDASLPAGALVRTSR